MNKTININLGGFFFHIDEIAYQKLRRYLDAVSKSLSDDPQGKTEIISDIEARISELLSERITDARQVVNEGDIAEIITIMGQPEDYAEAEEGYANDTSYQYKKRSSKKLFRDGDDKLIGGVAAGIAHYVSIDVIWVRLLFLLFSAGGGLPVYIILWILVPEAQSTAEKLQMEGEAVNIDNIERKIRDEFQHIKTHASEFSGKVKDKADHLSNKFAEEAQDLSNKYKKNARSGLQEIIQVIGKIGTVFFNIIGKSIGVLLMFIASAVLLSIAIGGFSLGSIEFLQLGNEFASYPPFFYDVTFPKWLLTLFLFIAIAVPFLIVFVLGLRILSSSVKRFSRNTSLTLLGIWIVALLALGFTGIEYAGATAYKGSKTVKTTLDFVAKDSIQLRVINDDNLYFNNNLRRKNNQEIVTINTVDKLYSNNLKIDIKESENNESYITVRRTSEGKSRRKAKNSATDIDYHFTSNVNEILLDAYFINTLKNTHKNNSVTVTVYIPKDVTVYFDNSTKSFLYDVKNTEDIYDNDMVNHYFTMSDKGFQCTDCDAPVAKEMMEE